MLVTFVAPRDSCMYSYPFDAARVQVFPSSLGFNTSQPGTHVSHGQSLEQGSFFSLLSMAADGSRGFHTSYLMSQDRFPDDALLTDVSSSWMPQVLRGTGNRDKEYRRGGTNRCIHEELRGYL